MDKEKVITINNKSNVFRFEENTNDGILYILNIKSHEIFECSHMVYKILGEVDGKKYNDNLISNIVSDFKDTNSEEVLNLLADLKGKEIIEW